MNTLEAIPDDIPRSILEHFAPSFDTLLLAAGATPSGETSGSVLGLVLFVLLALGASFLCSVWEAVLLSSSHSYIEVKAETGSRAAIIMRGIKENIENAITAILTMNTIAHTVGAAGAGAQAVAVFGNQWFGVISAVLTFLILVFSEIIPKTLGALYWKQLMPFTAYGVRALIFVLYPVVRAFRLISDLITPDEKEPTITRSEFEALAEIGQDEGALNKVEHLIVQNLLRLSDVQVWDIMTPRTVVFMLSEDLTVGEVAEKNPVLAYSRIPVYRENHDDIMGFVLRYQILSAVAEDRHDLKLSQLVMPIHPVPESLSVARVLQEFITRREHIFLVLDEYGGTSGIVTMEDALESLLGAEIMDESDVVADMRTLAIQRYERRQKLLSHLPPRSASDGNGSSKSRDLDLSASGGS